MVRRASDLNYAREAVQSQQQPEKPASYFSTSGVALLDVPRHLSAVVFTAQVEIALTIFIWE